MKSQEDLEKHLETSLESGLTQAKAAVVFNQVGENTLTERNKVPWYVMFIHEQTGFFSLLLWLGAALCFIAYALASYQESENPTGYLDPSNLYLGIVLATVVFITGVFSYFQSSKAASLMDDFKNFIPKTAQVLRDGKWEEIESKKLVPGDVIKVKGGDNVPADIVLFEANEMKVDNSSLTGEPEQLIRNVGVRTTNILES